MGKYKVGDKVIIVNYHTDEMDENNEMHVWFRKVMTIATNDGSDFLPYTMEEDYGRWNWGDEMIQGLASEVYSSIGIKLHLAASLIRL